MGDHWLSRKRQRKEQHAEYMRERRQREAERRAQERLRDRREQKQYELRKQRAAQGDKCSIEWVEKKEQADLLLAFYQSGLGKPGPRPDTPDGWSYSEGKYIDTYRRKA